MQIDMQAVNALTEKEKRMIILRSKLIYLIVAILAIIGGTLLILFTKGTFLAVLLFLVGLGGLIFFFIREDEKKEQKLYASYVSKQKIKSLKAAGSDISKDDVDRMRFETDPIFYSSILRSVKSKADADYNSKVSLAKSQLEKLQTRREAEYNKLRELRWDCSLHKNFAVNMTEGKIRINGKTEKTFSDIIGCDLHIETYKKTEGKSTVKGKTHASVGGAVLGGALGGASGAVIGGLGLGKKSYKGVLTLTTTTICSHLGVYINLAGVLHEVVLLSSDTSCGTETYKKAVQTALEIISKLQYLAKLTVPDNIPEIEPNEKIIDLNSKISEAEKVLQAAMDDKPVYRLPEKYGGTEIKPEDFEKEVQMD